MNEGKLIVLEGTDGAGKGTQLTLLVGYLKANHIPYASFDFPQYYKTFFGKWVGKFMGGEFGEGNPPAGGVSPYIITIPYAADRWQAKKEIEDALKEGKLVIVNRYATSNAAYQAAKLPKSERQEFIDWNFEMEYNQFGIPKEDLVIFLHVPPSISQELIEQKDKRKYLGNGKKDLYEKDVKLMQEVEKVYLGLAKTYHHWETVECIENGQLLTKEQIHDKVLEILRQKKYL